MTEWCREHIRLQTCRPRSIIKRFGTDGPSFEELAAYKEEVKAWQRAYRHASKMLTEETRRSNDLYFTRKREEAAAADK